MKRIRLAGCRRGERFSFVVATSVAFGRLKPSLRTLSDRLLARILALLWLTSLLLSACGPTPAPEATEPPVTGGILVVDALQRTVELAQLPQRIVVAGQSSLTIVDTLYLFPESPDRLVGLVVGRQPIGEFVSLADPAFAEKAILEPGAGPEQIAPLNPDVVLLRSFMAENLGRALEEIDIPVVYLDLETPDQYFRDLVTLGQLLGNDDRARQISAYYEGKLEDVVSRVGTLAPEEQPSALLLQYSDQGGEVALNVPSASWLQTLQVELAGGIPVWTGAAQGGGWTVVGFEQIAAWDPDQIFVVHYNADSAETAGQLAANAQWQALRAVQSGEIYGFPADIFSWDQPDPRWILGLTWLAKTMHPGLFVDVDMMAELSEFFGEMYALEPGTIQAEILPRLQGDVQ
jgi:iron complex transport system substrate-binding protein